jgi:hypothetical protein
MKDAPKGIKVHRLSKTHRLAIIEKTPTNQRRLSGDFLNALGNTTNLCWYNGS